MKRTLLLLFVCACASASNPGGDDGGDANVVSDGASTHDGAGNPTPDAGGADGGNAGNFASNAYCLPGDKPNFGPADGPAAMPNACYYTALSATPSTGQVTTVAPGNGTLQTALDNAKCGDVLVLTAGQTYTGNVTLPALSCNANAYVTIESSAMSSLPAEGNRISPCYAGVATLPGRPAYACPSGGAAKLMPTLTGTQINQPIVTVAPGANHYRLMGLEIVQTAGVHEDALVKLTQGDHIILDRDWIHGTATDENQAGVNANGTYLAVIDSYLNDSKCLTTGACIDSQAINGGVGNNAEGPIKIVNDFLESAGESFIFGGGAATAVPQNFEIRHNHSFKPTTWRVQDQNYIGVQFIIKNNGELKNGQYALIEGNVFENDWEGQSDQFGTIVLLTPKSQSGLCPSCVVTDVTFRYNVVRHGVNGLGISAALSDTGAAAMGIHRVSVHDNVFDDLDLVAWSQGSGACCAGGIAIKLHNENTAPAGIEDSITIEHNTMLAIGENGGNSFLDITNSAGASAPMKNVIVRNNIYPGGLHGSFLASGGQTIIGGTNVLDGMFGSTWTFANNLMPTNVFAKEWLNSPYPSTNQTCGSGSATCFPSDFTGVFVNYKSGNGGDYHLAPSSPYKGGGTDGLDLGANIDDVGSYTAGN